MTNQGLWRTVRALALNNSNRLTWNAAACLTTFTQDGPPFRAKCNMQTVPFPAGELGRSG